MDFYEFISKFLIYPAVFWLVFKRMIKGEEWFENYQEKIRLDKLELTHLLGEITRLQANYDNGWRPSNPQKFKVILKKLKKHPII